MWMPKLLTAGHAAADCCCTILPLWLAAYDSRAAAVLVSWRHADLKAHHVAAVVEEADCIGHVQDTSGQVLIPGRAASKAAATNMVQLWMGYCTISHISEREALPYSFASCLAHGTHVPYLRTSCLAQGMHVNPRVAATQQEARPVALQQDT